MPNVFDFLKAHNIPYEVQEHPAVFTVEEAARYHVDPGVGASKNLFLTNQKGDTYYLVTMVASKMLEMKKLGEELGERLRFASEEKLAQYLGLTRGSVSPFGLLNDHQKEVVFVIDNDLLRYEKLGFHPNLNTQTVILRTSDFESFLAAAGHAVVKKEI